MPEKRKEGKEGGKKFGDHSEKQSVLCDEVFACIISFFLQRLIFITEIALVENRGRRRAVRTYNVKPPACSKSVK